LVSVGRPWRPFAGVAPFLIAGLLTAIGLGFILKDSILIGLFVISLGVAALGYYTVRRRRHG
jgi:hypothetical protein